MLHGVKLLWYEGLRDEVAYPRGYDFLHDVSAGTFSPLGVLCDIAHTVYQLPLNVEDQTAEGVTFRVYDGASLLLPDSIRRWAVLRAINPRLRRGRIFEQGDEGINWESIAMEIWEQL